MKVKCVKSFKAGAYKGAPEFEVVVGKWYEVTSANGIGQRMVIVWLHGIYDNEAVFKSVFPSHPVTFPADCFDLSGCSQFKFGEVE